MGWLSKVLYRRDGYGQHCGRAKGCFKGIGFTVGKDELFRDADDVFENPVNGSTIPKMAPKSHLCSTHFRRH